MPLPTKERLVLHSHERQAIDFVLANAPVHSVLDIGCGDGRTSGILSGEYSLTVTAFDIDANAIERARYRYPNIDFSVLDAQDMSRFADNIFDAAIFSANGMGLIPTVEGRHKCLAEVARVLRPGGMFIYSAHSLHGLFRHHDPKRILRNNFHRVLRGDSYLTNIDKSGNTMSLYHGTPAREQKDLAKAGLKLLAKFQREWFDHWPYYVAQKPDSRDE